MLYRDYSPHISLYTRQQRVDERFLCSSACVANKGYEHGTLTLKTPMLLYVAPYRLRSWMRLL